MSIRQTCVYVGKEKLSMLGKHAFNNNVFGYNIIDARTLDGDSLLESESVNDMILSLICKNGIENERIDRILRRISQSEMSVRSEAFARLVALASLRSVRNQILNRMIEMGFSVDLNGIPLFEQAFRQHWDAGARAKELKLVINAIMKRFGNASIDEDLVNKIKKIDSDEILDLILRISAADTIDDALKTGTADNKFTR